MDKSSRREFLRQALVSTAAVAAGLKSLQAVSAAGGQKKGVDRRVLGRIGVEVSILGLGLGSPFAKPYGKDAEGAIRLLRRAIEHGVNYWDTARGYGASEERIGPAVKEFRNRIFLVSKSGDRTYDGFRRQLETSLKNLQTDHLDLCHIHALDPKSDADLNKIEQGAVRAVRKAKEEKLIGHFGITGHGSSTILMEAIKRWDPDAILTTFPASRPENGRFETELLPLATERKMGVIAMKTVRHARDADLKGSDLIRYALSLKGVHCAIVGLDTAAHLDENAAMATDFRPLNTKERNAMYEHVRVALAGTIAPWDRAGYVDGAVV